MQTMLATQPANSVPPARSSPARVARRVIGDRRVMAALTVLGVVLYLWHAPQAIDYPWYDEANYFFRGQRLLAGDSRAAGINSVGSSPLYIAYYAMWSALLHTSLVYPMIFATAILLMGQGSYLLLSRFLHPALAWALALYVAIGAAPVTPQHGLYYTGTAALWMSLALLGRRPLARGLGAFAVVATVFLRTEYLGVALLLLGLLAIYEWRQIRAHLSTRERRPRAARVAPCYLPAVLVLLLILILTVRAPGDGQHVESVIPQSYNLYLAAVHPNEFDGMDSLAQPFVLFERNYGPVRPRTLPNVLLAMARRPDLTGPYLGYESERLLAAFGSSTFTAWGYTARGPAWVARLSIWNTWFFGLGAIGIALLAIVCAFDLKRRGLRSPLAPRRDIPALLGILSLLALVPWLLLISPQERFWMTYPLMLLAAGWALSTILGWLALRLPQMLPSARCGMLTLVAPWAAIVGTLMLLVLVPHPWASTAPQPHAATIAFLRRYVPRHSTIVGAPLASYTDYLVGDGYPLDALEATGFQPSPLVQAEQYDSHLRYALLTDLFPQSTYAGWFADWQRTYPKRSWTLVAQQAQPALQLFELSPSNSTAAPSALTPVGTPSTLSYHPPICPATRGISTSALRTISASLANANASATTLSGNQRASAYSWSWRETSPPIASIR